jgi:type II secretory pathway pseudopilin PulG
MKNKSGFTLIEALIYIATLSVVISAIVSFLFWSIRSNVKAGAMREVSDNVRRAVETISHEIKESKSIYTPTMSFSQLSLETTKYLPVGEKSSYVDFYVATGTIYFKKEGRDAIALTSDSVEVKNLLFSQISTTTTSPSIRIGLRIDFKNPNNRLEYSASLSVTSTVSVRSY